MASKTAQELVDAHPHSRIRTKIEVFDWLLRNEDKRVGKNPAGYLVASIRSDYKVPGDYQCPDLHSQTCRTVASDGSELDPQRSRHAQRQANEEVQAQRDKVREARLRAAWEQLPEAERDAILVAVKVENPGLGRWKNMLEPLCLSELESRMKESGTESGQRLLFPEVEPAHELSISGRYGRRP